jgi:hypothetical protein
MKRAPLVGQAPEGRFQSTAADGSVADPNQAIFPIVSQDEDDRLTAIGTGFFIAHNGVFVTARHVIDEILNDDGVPTKRFGLIQLLPDNTYYLRGIQQTTRHVKADVAVGVAAQMSHNVTGAPMPNRVLTIARRQPAVGSAVCTYAYPKTVIVHGDRQHVMLGPGFFEGELVEALPDGRDRVMMPGACYQTSMVVHGGASGGPVFSPDAGTVFAVNSTGFNDETLSYVSCISSMLDLQINNVKLPGESQPKQVLIRELIEGGFAPSM